MKKYTYLVLSFLAMWNLSAQTESEPNNSFSTGNFVTENSTVAGNTNSTNDISDYFKILPAQDGTITIYLSATNTGGSSGYLLMYIYDARRASGTVISKYIGRSSSVGAGNTVLDTIKLYGRGSDSLHFKLDPSGNFNYTLRYVTDDLSTNDAEPNNLIAQALPFTELQEKSGHRLYFKGSP